MKNADVTTEFQFTTAAAASTNNAPVITSAAAVACTTGKSITYTVTATDADNDPVTFTISGQPSWATFATPKITLNPTETSKNDTITVIAADGNGGSDTLALSVTVIPGTGVTIGSRTAGSTFSLQLGSVRFSVHQATGNEPLTVSLFSLNGTRIFSRTITMSGSSRTVALPEELTGGVYLVQVQSAFSSYVGTVSLHR